MDYKDVKKIYNNLKIDTCPFTDEEISELDKTRELLIYLPSNTTMQELCEIFGIKSSVNFFNETMINNVMVEENQWFITSSNKIPEFLDKSGLESKRLYEDEGLHGMDFRRYVAFAGFYKRKFGEFPDKNYWTFLLSGSYDRSGISIIGFDRNNILSHHGWMKNFKSKFCGSRYIVLPPRIELTTETEKLTRAYRGKKSDQSLESSIENI